MVNACVKNYSESLLHMKSFCLHKQAAKYELAILVDDETKVKARRGGIMCLRTWGCQTAEASAEWAICVWVCPSHHSYSRPQVSLPWESLLCANHFQLWARVGMYKSRFEEMDLSGGSWRNGDVGICYLFLIGSVWSFVKEKLNGPKIPSISNCLESN